MTPVRRLAAALILSLSIASGANAQLAATGTEPTAAEVQKALKVLENKQADEIAKGLALLKLANFGPKSVAATPDLTRFLLRYDGVETSAINTIAVRIGATADAVKPAIAEIRKIKAADPAKRQRVLDGMAHGSIASVAPLIADPALRSPAVLAVYAGLEGRALGDADRVALKPQVPNLAQLLAAFKPSTGPDAANTLTVANRAIELIKRLGPDGSAALDTLKKIADTPSSPLQSAAASAISTPGVVGDSPESLVAMLADEKTRGPAMNGLAKLDLQQTLSPLAKAIAAATRSDAEIAALGDLLGYRAQRTLEAQNAKGPPPPPLVIDAALKADLKAAALTLSKRMDPTGYRGLDIAQKTSVIAAAFANDVPEMLDVLVNQVKTVNPTIGGEAMERLRLLGDLGMAAAEKLAADPDPRVAQFAGERLNAFRPSDPMALAKQMLAGNDDNAMKRGLQRLGLSGADAIDAWILLLSAPNFEDAQIAAIGLRKLSAEPAYKERALPAIVKQLADPNYNIAQVAAIAWEGDAPAIIEPLKALTLRRGDVTNAPTDALARSGPLGAKALADMAAAITPRDVQPYLAGTLETIGVDATKANLAAIAKAAANENNAIAAAAIKLMGAARPASDAALLTLTKSTRTATRAAVIEVLDPAVPADATLLAQMLADKEPDVSRAAGTKLAGNDAGRLVVLNNLKSPDAAARTLAIDLLVTIGRPSDGELDAIATLTQDADVTVRRRIYQLASSANRLAERVAIGGMNEKDREARSNALYAVGELRTFDSHEPLLTLARLAETDAVTSSNNPAGDAMGKIVMGCRGNAVLLKPAAIDGLLAATSAKEAPTRRRAIGMLGSMIRPTDERIVAVRDAATKLTKDEDPATREAATQALRVLAIP